jgi:hypothetical protein
VCIETQLRTLKVRFGKLAQECGDVGLRGSGRWDSRSGPLNRLAQLVGHFDERGVLQLVSFCRPVEERVSLVPETSPRAQKLMTTSSRCLGE